MMCVCSQNDVVKVVVVTNGIKIIELSKCVIQAFSCQLRSYDCGLQLTLSKSVSTHSHVKGASLAEATPKIGTRPHVVCAVASSGQPDNNRN